MLPIGGIEQGEEQEAGHAELEDQIASLARSVSLQDHAFPESARRDQAGPPIPWQRGEALAHDVRAPDPALGDRCAEQPRSELAGDRLGLREVLHGLRSASHVARRPREWRLPGWGAAAPPAAARRPA